MVQRGRNVQQRRPPSRGLATKDSGSSAILGELVLDSLTAHVAVLDASGAIVAVNAAWKSFALANGGSHRTWYVGENYLQICESAARRAVEPTASAALTGITAVLRGDQELFSLEYPCHSPHEPRWFMLRVTRLSRDHGGIVVAHQDITAQKTTERALRDAESTLREVLDLLPVGVWILDRTGHILQGNPAGQRIWGGARYVGIEEFGEYQGWWLRTGEPIGPHEWGAARAIEQGETSLNEEIEIEAFDGTHKVLLHSAIPLLDAEKRITGAIVVNQDITARESQEQELLRARAAAESANRELREALAREQLAARTDFLTGLNNRRHFLELAAHEWSVAERYGISLSVMLFDVDRFKQINDSAGHEVGDEILKRIAGTAASHLREADVLARYGGEEFIVLLPGSTAQQAAVVAERIREAVAASAFDTLSARVSATISIGVAEAGAPRDTLVRLIRRADRALYRAKDAGRNRTVVDSRRR